MKLQIKKGTTSKLVTVFIQDSSSSTGAGLTGLVYNSAGLTAYYYREGAGTGATAITLATMTLGTWATGGFVAVDGTNMPGVYEIGLPDAVLASGADSVSVMLKGATNMAPLTLEIQLTDIDLHDSVRAGMTALPNAAPDAAGGLPISDAGGLDLDTLLGYLTGSVATATALATAQADLDTITGADGATLATSQPNYTPAVAGDSMALTAGAVDDIWDEPLTAHTTNQTPGKVLKGISEAWIQAEGSVNDASATTTSFVTDLTSARNDYYKDAILVFISEVTGDTVKGVGRPIASYTAATKVVTFDEAFPAAPANTDQFIILAGHTHPISEIVAGVVGDAVIAELTTQGDTNEAKIDIIDANVDAVLADTADMQPKLGTPAADISADIAAVKSDSAAILTDTGTTLPAILGTPAGADLATDIAAIKVDTAAILIDTNELQGDWTNGGRLDLIIDAILDDTGTSGVVLTAAERNSIADAILDRDMSTGSDSGSTTVRTVRQALRANRNKVTISGGTLTVYKEDDATASWTASVSTTAGDPISDINPAGGS